MKIVFATSSFKGGGITSYALEVISHYSIENDIFVFVGDDLRTPINGLNKNINRIKCESDDVSINNALFAIHEINEVIRPDVIINSNSKIISFITPFILDNIKIVTVSHSLRYLETNVAAITNQYTDNIIGLSQFNKQYIDRRYRIKDKHKTKVVYNFVADGNNVQEIVDRKKKAVCLNIVFMGGSLGSKTPELVLNVLKKLLKTKLDFHFYWLGVSSPTLKSIQPYNDIVEILPQDKRLTITGKIPRADAEVISQNANILLIPSRREGCPMALLEAMRYGVISITSDYKNACMELIKNGYNGFVLSHKDPQAFYEKICELIINHSHYLSYYDNSIKVFNSKLSFPVWKTKMDAIIYSDQLSHKKRKPSFSKAHYNFIKIRFNMINLRDNIHKTFFETIPSAFAFFVEYFKTK